MEESSIKDTDQGLVVTWRLQRDSGNLEGSQCRAVKIKDLESKTELEDLSQLALLGCLVAQVRNRLSVLEGFAV